LHFRAKRLKTQAERGAWAPVKPAVMPAEKASENSSF
jgi:hypothetical protein